MYELARLVAPPPNLEDFVHEILPGFRNLYGDEAAEGYAAAGVSGISASIAHPDVRAYGRRHQSGIDTLLLTRRTGNRTTLSFLHELESARPAKAGESLLRFAMNSMGADETILTDFIPTYRGDWDAAFRESGFREIRRQLMRRSATDALAPRKPNVRIVRTTPADLPALAGVLTDTYRESAEGVLFPETQSETQALDYLHRTRAGHYGRHTAAHCLSAWDGQRCTGFILGAQVLPGLGFVLHLTVRPEARSAGIGTALLHGLIAGFALEGLDYVALGVTCDNPAVTLYQRAGFRVIAPIPVFYRVAEAHPAHTRRESP